MTKNLKAAARLVAYTAEQKLQRLHERREGLPHSGADYVEGTNEDLDRVVPHADPIGQHLLKVAVDKLDRMPERRHNFQTDDIDVGSMTRPIGEEVVRKLQAEREFVVQLPTSYNEDDGTMNVVRLNVMATSVEEATAKAEAELRARLADGARIVSAALVTSGRETGFGAGVLLFCKPTGRFLFVKRSETGDQPGTWCTGGGGVEDYETIHEGVERENREELGYDKPLDLIHMDRQVSPDGSFIFHNHMAVIDEEFEPVLNDEHTEYKWCEADEIPQPLHPGLDLAITNWMKRQGAAE